MRLASLKTQALRHLALGEHESALLIYRAILRSVPSDLDARMKVADVLVDLKEIELAQRVYAAVAWCDLQCGRPLHALVCGQALSDLGQSPASIHESLAALYAAGAPRLARTDERGWPAGPDPETEVSGVDLGPLPRGIAAESAAEVAADVSTFQDFPRLLTYVPLLSEVSSEALLAICGALCIRRLLPRGQVFRAGSPAHSIFFLASGTVEVGLEEPQRAVLGHYHEGELFGELSLLASSKRVATVEACEPTDVIELPVRSLRALCQDHESLAGALDRMTTARLGRLAVHRCPVFSCLTEGQRLEIQRRFVLHRLERDTVLVEEGTPFAGLYVVVSGEVVVSRGDEPFESIIAHLSAGDVFGEIALVRSAAATATVRTVGPAAVLLMPQEAFERMCCTIPAVTQELERLSQDALRDLSSFGRSVLPTPASLMPRSSALEPAALLLV